MRAKQKLVPTVLLAILASFGLSGMVIAATPQAASSNFRVNEVFFGSGGALRNCSATYCSKQSLGETVVGNTASGNYQAQGGFNTNRTPFLQFVVSNTNQDIGTLTSATTKTATATFAVKSYLSSGYVVKQTSPGPTNGSFVLSGLATPTASAVGTEQFGINLAANTSPATMGAGPVQNPGTTFSHGQVSAGYNTANQYKYVTNDTIAYSDMSSGETDYTISYIFNNYNSINKRFYSTGLLAPLPPLFTSTKGGSSFYFLVKSKN